MTRLLRLICVSAIAATLAAAGAGAASAATFYVNTSGNDKASCEAAEQACRTIAAAVERSATSAGPARIEVGPGTYSELVSLKAPNDDGITINGAGSGSGGTEIAAPATTSEPVITGSLFGAPATLSNLEVVAPSGASGDGIEGDAELQLENVVIGMRDPKSTGAGVEVPELGSLAMSDSAVFMEAGTLGAAVQAKGVPVSVVNSKIVTAPGAEAVGISSSFGPLTVTGTTLQLEGSDEFAGIKSMGGTLTLDDDNLTDSSTFEARGIEAISSADATISNVTVDMTGAGNENPGIAIGGGSAHLENVNVSGSWAGPPLSVDFAPVTVADSHLTAASAGPAPAAAYASFGEGAGLLIQRSVLQAAPTAAHGALDVIAGNVAVDSSEVLGGKSAIDFEDPAAKERNLTVTASTLDAGTPGVLDEPGDAGVELIATGAGAIATADLKGTISLEPQIAKVEAGARSSTVSCTHSQLPSQQQNASGTSGSIECSSGAVTGDAELEPATLGALFSEPVTAYALNPASAAIDSVPSSAITLPFGQTPSSTDLAGNARTVQVGTGGVCAAYQDPGALQLTGQAAACTPAPPSTGPPAVVAKPLAGVLSALTLSPSSFYPAPSGATSSASKRKSGTKVRYNDSQAAVTTFTVLLPLAGRTQGHSCRKPSRKNKHGHHCTYYRPLGSFTHTDIAGVNSFHFSGRLHGHKLPAGSYRLQAVTHDAAGNGATVTKTFKIK